MTNRETKELWGDKVREDTENRRSRKRCKRSTYGRTEKNKKGSVIRSATLVDMLMDTDDLFF
jgi:hypothetical protein